MPISKAQLDPSCGFLPKAAPLQCSLLGRYPAGHLVIYRFFYYLTNTGANVKLAQWMHGGLYIISQLSTMALYSRAEGTPNLVLLLLPLSKRLHSIYALRMFNDCWAATIMHLSVLAFSEGFDDLGAAAFR